MKRFYDVVVEESDVHKFYKELKSWDSYYDQPVKTQFIRDLSNKEFKQLGDVEWVFRKSKTLDRETLKKNVIRTLRNSDEELDGLLGEDDVRERIRTMFLGSPTDDIDKEFLIRSIDENFDKIFIIEER